jgi:predicted nucleic-acid-binding protein
MIGLDTNILVRYLTQDHAIQSPIATDLIENRLSEHELGFVTTVALAETIWVLERAYRLNAVQIAGALTRLL